MARLTFESLPQAPPEYSQRQQQTLVRILGLVLRKTDYTPQADHTAHLAHNWIGL